jgi:hypothetical protein
MLSPAFKSRPYQLHRNEFQKEFYWSLTHSTSEPPFLVNIESSMLRDKETIESGRAKPVGTRDARNDPRPVRELVALFRIRITKAPRSDVVIISTWRKLRSGIG